MNRSQRNVFVERARSQLQAAGLSFGPEMAIEVADFGLERFEAEGLGLVVRVNEPEYCSKWLTLFPGQRCPRHYHRLKKETFFVLAGTVTLQADSSVITLAPGQNFTIAPGTWHAFWSETGAVIEEVSTHDENADSYFDDPAIRRDPAIEEDVD